MTITRTLLSYLESLGAQLKVEGESIRLRAPDGVLADDLQKLIRDHKTGLLELLQVRQRFHYKEAVLFKLIGHRVATSQGRGELLSVSRRYCRVELERTGAVVLHRPAELISLLVAEFTHEVAA